MRKAPLFGRSANKLQMPSDNFHSRLLIRVFFQNVVLTGNLFFRQRIKILKESEEYTVLLRKGHLSVSETFNTHKI